MSGDTLYMVPKGEQSVKSQISIRSTKDAEIGARIRELREGLGVSTRQFAEGVSGLRTSNLSEIERGLRRASAGVLQGIQRKYGASVDWLLTGKDPGKDPGVSRMRARAIPILEVDVAMSYLFDEGGEPPSYTVPPSEEFAPAVTEDPRAIQIRAEGSLRIRGIDTIFIEPGREIQSGDVVLVKSALVPPEICRYNTTEAGEVVLVNYANPGKPPIVLGGRAIKSMMMYRVSGLFKRL